MFRSSSCSATTSAVPCSAAIDSVEPDARRCRRTSPSLIAPIVPAVQRVPADGGDPDALEVGREHLRDTVAELLERSELISDAVAAGTLAVVGANYRLLEGTRRSGCRPRRRRRH